MIGFGTYFLYLCPIFHNHEHNEYFIFDFYSFIFQYIFYLCILITICNMFNIFYIFETFIISWRVISMNKLIFYWLCVIKKGIRILNLILTLISHLMLYTFYLHHQWRVCSLYLLLLIKCEQNLNCHILSSVFY